MCSTSSVGSNIRSRIDDDDEFRFNDVSTHEGHLRQNGELTWFCNETMIMISHRSRIEQPQKQ